MASCGCGACLQTTRPRRTRPRPFPSWSGHTSRELACPPPSYARCARTSHRLYLPYSERLTDMCATSPRAICCGTCLHRYVRLILAARACAISFARSRRPPKSRAAPLVSNFLLSPPLRSPMKVSCHSPKPHRLHMSPMAGTGIGVCPLLRKARVTTDYAHHRGSGTELLPSCPFPAPPLPPLPSSPPSPPSSVFYTVSSAKHCSAV